MIDDNSGTEKYLLSMKDQCTVDILPGLLDAGIDSLKIEGRMKKPEYTAFVTSAYRKYIDLYLEHPEKFKVDGKDLENLKHMYLRSEIGTGYYHTANGRNMITLESPAYNGNDEALMKTVSESLLSGIKKRPVSMFASLIPGEKMSLTITYEHKSVSVYGDTVSKPLNRPVSTEDVLKQLGKLGDTPFVSEDIYVEMPKPSFVPLKAINELRREAVTALMDELSVKAPVRETAVTVKSRETSGRLADKPIVMVHSKEQAEVAFSFDNIYVGIPAEVLLNLNVKEDNVIAVLPDVIRIKDYDYVKKILKQVCDNNICAVYVRNFEGLNLVKDLEKGIHVIAGSEIYTANASAAGFIDGLSDAHVAPLELSYRELKECYDNSTYLFAYGKLPLMHTANCVLKTSKGCAAHKDNPFVYIKDRTDTVFPVYRNCDICSNIIYNSVPTFLFEEIKDSAFSRKRVILSFTDESASETENIINLYLRGLGNAPEKYTKAYWKRGVE